MLDYFLRISRLCFSQSNDKNFLCFFEIISIYIFKTCSTAPTLILKCSLIAQTIIKSKHGTNSNKPLITNVNKLNSKLLTKGRLLVIN